MRAPLEGNSYLLKGSPTPTTHTYFCLNICSLNKHALDVYTYHMQDIRGQEWGMRASDKSDRTHQKVCHTSAASYIRHEYPPLLSLTRPVHKLASMMSKIRKPEKCQNDVSGVYQILPGQFKTFP